MSTTTQPTGNFGFNLFSQALTAAKPGENVVISPASVEIALAMTFNGARCETKESMASVLGLPPGASYKTVNAAFAGLQSALKSADPKVELAIANALWANADVAFKAPFLQRTQQFYGARVTSLDFQAPETLGVINGWVSESTRGKIPTILERISRDAILFLMNAIYFKGTWSREFDKSLTQDRNFTLLGGTQKKVPMMLQSGKYRYLRGTGFQAVSLPYGGNGQVSMYIFLPDQATTLQGFQQTLTADNWNNWLGRFRLTDGDIHLPRFKVEYFAELSAMLKALGMGIAFDDGKANFKSMCELPRGENVKIDEVRHKTFIEVNEEGTEAAAVTSVGMARTTSVQLPQERFSMVVDRPFVFAIRDNTTGTILFLGSIVKP